MSHTLVARTLPPGGIVNLGAAAGQRLHVLKGAAWVTLGDEHDHVVRTGEHLDLDGGGIALVTALLEPVVFEVEPADDRALAA